MNKPHTSGAESYVRSGGLFSPAVSVGWGVRAGLVCLTQDWRMRKTVNINDIARLAGVSRSTVSRVLTDNKNVKRETAVKVKQAMREVNYRPNIVARGLATGKLNIIAILILETTHPFYLQLLEYLDGILRERGYILSVCYLGKTEKARRENLRNIQEYGFSGFIMADVLDDPGFVEELRSFNRPLVFCNRYLESLSAFDAVVVDNYLGGYMAARYLLDLGHRRFGVLTGPLLSSASRDRFRGYRSALAEAGLELGREMIAEGDLTIVGGMLFAEAFFAKHGKDECTALFAGNDSMAIGILNYCRVRGIRVPEDISLIGFDDQPYAASPMINLTTIQQPVAKMSEFVAELVIRRIDGHTPSRQCIMLEPKLIERGSTRSV